MATGMREKTTNVGGVIKRIWYAMTGTTQGPQLLSLDDTGNLEAKLLNPVINGTATGTATTTTGEANKLVKTNSLGNLTLGSGKITANYPYTRQPFNYTAQYGDNIVYTQSGGQLITLPAITDGAIIRIYKALDVPSYSIHLLTTDVILSKAGVDVTATYTTVGSLNTTSYLELKGVTISSELKWMVIKEDTFAVRELEKKRFDSISSSSYFLSALNVAPASSTATGTTGEVRIDANHIYICTATNSWKRTALTTW